MRSLISEMRQLLTEKHGGTEKVVIYAPQGWMGSLPWVKCFSFPMGQSYEKTAFAVWEGESQLPGGKANKAAAKKMAKEQVVDVGAVITLKQWQRLMPFDEKMGGSRVIAVKDIDWKKVPSTGYYSKLYQPVFYYWKLTAAQAQERKDKQITPTFAMATPYKKDFVTAFGQKVPKESKRWDKMQETWIIDQAYEPLVRMLIFEFFMVEPREENKGAPFELMDIALWADKKKKKGGQIAPELSVKEKGGWLEVVTPWNPAFLKALKSLPYSARKWDNVEKHWKVKVAYKDEVIELIKDHYKKEPAVEGHETLGDLISELLWASSHEPQEATARAE
jgi:hypothetical protein